MATRPSSVPAGQSSSSYDSMLTPLGRACRRAGGRALPGSAAVSHLLLLGRSERHHAWPETRD